MFHDDAPVTAEDIESGAYFKKARRWYSDVYHFPIAERSFYIVLILLALITSALGVQSFFSMFPLSVRVPFLVSSEDAWTDQPVAVKIALTPYEVKNQAVRRFLLQSYVASREEYDLEHYELRYRSIASQSTSAVFEKYKEEMDASNLYSPYRIYTNRFRRNVTVNPESISYEIEKGKEAHAKVIFYSAVLSVLDGRVIKRSKYQADITFQYSDFSVDQSLDSHVEIARLLGLTGESIRASGEKRKVVPMKFVVSGYNVREMLE